MKRDTFLKRVMVIGVAAMVILSVTPAGAALVGHWKLDETTGTNAPDSSGNTNHGTLIDGPTWDTGGVFNGAIGLDGSNDRIHVASVPDLKYTGGDITLSTWVYLDPGETYGRVISKPWNGSGRYNYILMYEGGATTRIRFGLGNSNPSATQNKDIVSPYYSGFREAWHHLAATVDSSNNMTLYVDGVQAATGVNPITDWTGLDLNTPLVLGSLYPYGSGWAGNTGFSVDGKIDDTAIWTDALDEAHARSIYTVPHDLGLDYDVADVIDLWDIHDSAGAGGIKGIPWQYRSSLPGSPALGDAYVYNGIMYVALGNGTGLAAVPEPSTFMLSALGLFGLALAGRRRRKRAA